MNLLIISILITMLFSAFFSGMEIAFISCNRMLVEMDRDRKTLASRPLQLFFSHPNNFVSTMLVGNNIALVIYGILFANLFDQYVIDAIYGPGVVPAGVKVTVDTIASTIVVLFTGEFLPKTIFKSNANRMLTVFAWPAWLCYWVLWPISRFATSLSKVCLRLTGTKILNEEHEEGFTRVELDYLVQKSIDNAEENEEEVETEVKIFQNAMDFKDTRVRDCMVPRTEVIAVDIDCPPEELMQKFIDSGKSKVIVYKEDIDHIEGYIHSSEMFRDSKEWRAHLREMPFVPETMAAQKLMQMFLQQKKSMGAVVDEFGGTAGIVCLEDIVEEIFGDIEDEHDNTKYVARREEDGSFVLSARLEIDDVNERFDLDLPESDDYMTIGGLILHEYQNFPKLNEEIRVGRYTFKVIKNTQTKILLVRMKIEEE